MPRRIDIELTSARDDGTWTWRAAGAKQPKGVLEGTLLYEGAKAGDVVKAEADFEIEGITITSVFPPKGKRAEPDRLEVIGPQQAQQPLVTSSLVPKNERRRDRDRDRDGERRGPRRPEGDRGPRPGRPPRADGGGDRPSRPRTGGGGGEGRGDAGRGPRETREPREARDNRGPRQPRPAATERPAPPKPKRLNPGHKHRTAVLEAVAPEQRPIAEQVLRGGIPAVRAAIEQENEKAKAEGRAPVNAEAITAMAEELLPRLKTAEWHDRADAAAQIVDEISLRDLRAVVTGADAAARDDETRTLAATLREALERRVAAQQQEWLDEMTRCLDEGRLVRALRVASRPPDPTSKFPPELAERMTDAASSAMAPDAAPDRWTVLIDAVANSPIRRSVKPVGLPAEPGEELLQLAREASGRIPALAAMLGIDIPPPPRATRTPPRPGNRAAGRPPRSGARPPAPRPPAPPVAATEPAAPAEATAAPLEAVAEPIEAVAAPTTEAAAAPAEAVAAQPAAPSDSSLPPEPAPVEASAEPEAFEPQAQANTLASAEARTEAEAQTAAEPTAPEPSPAPEPAPEPETAEAPAAAEAAHEPATDEATAPADS